MNPNIDSTKEMILLFKNELEKLMIWDKSYAFVLDGNDPIKPWQKREAYSWIFLETQYAFFLGVSEQTKRENRINLKNYPKPLKQKATLCHSKWENKEIEVGYGCKANVLRFEETNRYLKYGIPKPGPSESLIGYIKCLRNLVSKKKYRKKMWKESLGSFLNFVRENIPAECHGFIDVIFPEDRAFYSNTVVRLGLKEKFPTNIVFAAEVLKNLSEALLSGDPRSQHCAAEALALALLCLTSARLQYPTQIKLLYGFNGLSLMMEDVPERHLFPKRYLLKVPTLFGDIPMEISKLFYDYLLNLFQINQKIGIGTSFFKSSERSLGRAFNRAVSKLNLPPKHGDITFTTFTSWPTENLYHRTQIDNSRYTGRC